MRSDVPYFKEAVLAMLVAGSVFSPFAAALALLFLLGSQLAELEIDRKASQADDPHGLQTLRADVAKLKAKAEQEGLAKAFGR